MPHQTTTVILLLSAPGDISEAYISRAFKAINRWNFHYGLTSGIQVLPIHWQAHAAPVHGPRTQETLNAQLVDDSDLVIAMFWHRLGSDTGVAVSGTVEELERAAAAGKSVSVLRSVEPLPTNLDLGQYQRLLDYFNSIKANSYYLEFSSEAELAVHVDTILAKLLRQMPDGSVAAAVSAEGAGPPLLTVSARLASQTGSRSTWDLVLRNSGQSAAWDIDYTLRSPGGRGPSPLELGDHVVSKLLAPGNELHSQFITSSDHPESIECVLSWDDGEGSRTESLLVRLDQLD